MVITAYVVIRRRSRVTEAAQVMPEPLRVETALMAGVLAAATVLLVLNLVLYVLSAVDQSTPTEALLELGQAVGRRVGAHPIAVLAGGISLYVALQLLWAVVYAHVERWLPKPDWLGGLLFALVPLAFSLVVVMPLLGAGLAGYRLGMGPVPLAGETLRHVLYGLALSTSYTLLSRARASARRAPQVPQPAP